MWGRIEVGPAIGVARTMSGRVSLRSLRRPPAKGERVGDRLARLRREREISQSELGAKIGSTQRVVSFYESNRIRIPAETLLRIGDVLKVSIYELLGRAAASRPPMNRQVWKVVEQIQTLPPREQRPLLRMIDAYVKEARQA